MTGEDQMDSSIQNLDVLQGAEMWLFEQKHVVKFQVKHVVEQSVMDDIIKVVDAPFSMEDSVAVHTWREGNTPNTSKVGTKPFGPIASMIALPLTRSLC